MAARRADVPMLSIWSWHDSMVAPQDSASLPGARNIALVGVGHNALLREPDVTRLVAEALHGELAPSDVACATSGCPG